VSVRRAVGATVPFLAAAALFTGGLAGAAAASGSPKGTATQVEDGVGPEHKEACFDVALTGRPGHAGWSLVGQVGYYHRKDGKRAKRAWFGYRDTKPLLDEHDAASTCPGTIALKFRARDRNLRKGAKRKWLPNSRVYKRVKNPQDADPRVGYYNGKQIIRTFRHFSAKRKPEVVVTKTYTAFGESRSKRFRFNGIGPIGRKLEGAPPGGRPVQ